MLHSCNLFQLLPGLKRTALFSLSARGDTPDSQRGECWSDYKLNNTKTPNIWTNFFIIVWTQSGFTQSSSQLSADWRGKLGNNLCWFSISSSRFHSSVSLDAHLCLLVPSSVSSSSLYSKS